MKQRKKKQTVTDSKPWTDIFYTLLNAKHKSKLLPFVPDAQIAGTGKEKK